MRLMDFCHRQAGKSELKSSRGISETLIILGIGQGDVLVTPMQLTNSIAAISNGGTLYEPYLVQTQHTPKSHSVGVSAANLAAVRAAMRETVVNGSGRALSSLPIQLAGKTGTAQVGVITIRTPGLLVYGPYDKPTLVLTVLIERGGGGDTVAVPLAKEIWQWWGEHRLGLTNPSPIVSK